MTDQMNTASTTSKNISLIFYFRIIISFLAFITFLANFLLHFQLFLVLSAVLLSLLFFIRISEFLINRQPIPKKYFFGMGLIVGITFSFIAFEPNRIFVYQSVVGTPTNSPSPTSTMTETVTVNTTQPSDQNASKLPIETSIPTPITTDTPAITPTATGTQTITPSPRPRVIFSETFLDNQKGWSVPFVRSNLKTDVGKIIAGTYSLDLQCSVDATDACISWLRVPNVVERDFNLSFDANIAKVSPHDSRVVMIIRFRNYKDRFYSFYISNASTVSMDMKTDGFVKSLLKETNFPQITFIPGEENHFRVIIKDTKYTLLENETQILEMEDGNISTEGEIDIGFYLPKLGSFSRINLDDVLIEETP